MKETPKYEQRVHTIVVVPAGKQIFDESATYIGIEDEAAGEFIKVWQIRDDRDKDVRIDPEEWPVIRDAIDKIMKECRNYD